MNWANSDLGVVMYAINLLPNQLLKTIYLSTEEHDLEAI